MHMERLVVRPRSTITDRVGTCCRTGPSHTTDDGRGLPFERPDQEADAKYANINKCANIGFSHSHAQSHPSSSNSASPIDTDTFDQYFIYLISTWPISPRISIIYYYVANTTTIESVFRPTAAGKSFQLLLNRILLMQFEWCPTQREI